MTYARVLIATDLSDHAACAARLAVGMGSPRTRYRVVFVLPPPWPSDTGGSEAQRARQAKRRAAARDVVTGWAAQAGIPNADIAIVDGSVTREIVREVQGFAADLVALGHTGRGGIHRRLLGSTARGVLRAAGVDTLVARGPAPEAGRPILRRIVVATDFQAPSKAAAARALQLAKQHDADLGLVHCVDPSLWYDPGIDVPAEPMENGWLDSALQEKLHAFNEEHLQSRATEVILHGKPATAIARHAKLSLADLLVTGAHGGGVLDRALLGSVAESLVEQASCSVLLAR